MRSKKNKKLTWVVQRICHCQIHQQKVDCSVVLQTHTLWSRNAACHCQTSIDTSTLSRHEVYKVQSMSMIVGIWNLSNNYLSGTRWSGNKKEFVVKGNQEF